MRWRPRSHGSRQSPGAHTFPGTERGISVGGDNYGVIGTGDNAVNSLIQLPPTDSAPTQPERVPGASRAPAPPGQAFISYVREDSAHVDRLQAALEAASVAVWRDTLSLWPGQDWKDAIRQAINSDSVVFVACFSLASVARNKTYQREELLLALDQLRQRRPGEPWLIPVRFDACEIPDLDIGAGRTLASIQRVDLFGADYEKNVARLTLAVEKILAKSSRDTTNAG
jgi:hypothetical protein